MNEVPRANSKLATAALVPLVLLAALAVWVWSLSESDRHAAPKHAKSRHAARVHADDPSATKPESAETPERADDPAPATERPASLVVRVVEREGKKPIAGAAVDVIDADGVKNHALTGDDGAATFDKLAPGGADVGVSVPGSLEATRTLLLNANEKAELEVALEGATNLEGVFVDSKTGEPIANAEVDLFAPDPATGEPRRLGEARTDAKGRYEMKSVPASGKGEFRVRSGGRVRSVEIDLGSGTGARVEVAREPAGRMSGFVRDPNGHGVADASVALRRPGAPVNTPPERVADCGAEGAYAFDEIPLGLELVAVASSKEWAASAPTEAFTVGAVSADVHRDFSLRRPSSLTVVVPDPKKTEGRSPNLVMVRLDEEGAASALSLGSGTVTRDHLTPGLHRVRVSAEGFLPESRRVELAEGQSTTIEVKLTVGLTLSGEIVDAAGRGIDQAAVIASDPDLPHAARTLRRDASQVAIAPGGRFELGGLLPGRYEVSAYLPGGATSAVQMVVAPASGLRFVIALGTRVSMRVTLPPGVARPSVILASAASETLLPNLDGESEYGVTPEPRAWRENGTLECEVSPGETSLRLLVVGCAPAVVAIRTEAGRTVDLGEVRLERPVRVTGRVVDPEGQGIAGAKVWATLSDRSTPVETGAQGDFELGGLAPGPVIVRASADGRFGATGADAVADAAVVVVVRRTGRISGVVVDADGVPVSGAPVAVLHGFAESKLDRGRGEDVIAGADGSFTANVAAGRVRVNAGGAWVEAVVPEGGSTEVHVVAGGAK